MKTYDISSPVRLLLVSLVVAALYLFSAKLGLLLAVVQKNATPVWPPTGIAIAAMLIFGYRIWPGIFLGAFVVNLFTDITLLTSFALASGNTLESVVAVYLVWKLFQICYCRVCICNHHQRQYWRNQSGLKR